MQRELPAESKSESAITNISGRIAVAAVEDDENSQISDIAGRAPVFLIYDEKGNFIKSVKNPALGFGGGASTEVVSLLVRESCKTFIAGQFGMKMEAQLKTKKINYIEKQGLAKNVIKTLGN